MKIRKERKLTLTQHRTVVLLKQGLSLKEVASVLKVNEGTIQDRLKKLRKKFRAKTNFQLGYFLACYDL